MKQVMGVRKEGKARWVYRCGPCDITATAVDQLRAMEAQSAHQRTTNHVMMAMVAAFSPVVDAYFSMGTVIVETLTPAMKTIETALAAPTNIPYGPAPRDKRTWGGK
jgi:hypothetical protein